MKKCVWIFLFLWTQFACSDAVSNNLQAKLNAIRTMSASFHQVVSAHKHTISSTYGTMALSRPGRFRWQTKTPMPQLVLADGQRLWVYDVDLEQVSVRRQGKGLSGTTELFLSSYDHDLTRNFSVTSHDEALIHPSGTFSHGEKGKKKEGRYLEKKIYFDLHAKSSKASFQRIILAFSGANLVGIELFDPLGQHTQITLSHVKNNPQLPSSLFTFKMPAGVDRVEQ